MRPDRKVVLPEQGEDGCDEVGRERARAEQADTDQRKTDGGTGQGQHGNLSGNGCADPVAGVPNAYRAIRCAEWLIRAVP